MYNNHSTAGMAVLAPASVVPFQFPMNESTSWFWWILGSFALFAAFQAVKRILPTPYQIGIAMGLIEDYRALEAQPRRALPQGS